LKTNETMEKRTLGGTDLTLTTVGLGTWAIGGPWDWGWGPQDDVESIRTIHEALDLGVNWIDTAPTYGLGHSESIVGKALADRRHEVIIATKCGLVWDDASTGTVYGRLRGESVRAEAEASLRRLGVDHIDLYQIHWPNPEAEIADAWETMAALKQEGKVRHIGVSNFSVAQLERVAAIHPVGSLQPPYSMLERGFEGELRPYCESENVGVVAYSPMQAGLLTGRFDLERLESLPEGDWRLKNRHFQAPGFAHNLRIVEALRPLAAQLDRSLAELAVAWTLRDPTVTAAIVGARRPGQISATATASGFALPADVAREIERILTVGAI
jgi:aryl-alcohol dehydrogenase-like predicted oxidoreductase